MKILIAFLILIGVGDRARAVQHTNASPVAVMVPGSTTCTKVAISGTTPTEVSGNTAVLSTSAQVIALKVSNIDTSADLSCSHNSAVTVAGGSTPGDLIAHASAAPWNWLSWAISAAQPWYCLSSAGGGSNAIVCLTTAK